MQILNDWLSKEKQDALRDAAILIALFEKDGEYCFPMIKRPENVKNHPGQIALPGGSKEEEESLEETALREAQEEIGVNPDKIKIIGKGELDLAVKTLDGVNHKANRRVEIQPSY